VHFNYEYVLNFCAKHSKDHPESTILDFGCGKGEVVVSGLERGMKIFGADIFYNDYSRYAVQSAGLLGINIREIKDGVIDFPDGFFDLVVSNQVFEHVEDLNGTLIEISRVLKPEGLMLCLFPSVDVWREGHCGIPFVHRFAKNSRFRYFYMLSIRKLGYGKFKGEKTPEKWAHDFLDWIDRYCFYRKRKEIFNTFRLKFSISLIEDDYIEERIKTTRYRNLARIARLPVIRPIASETFRKLGGLVILAKKS